MNIQSISNKDRYVTIQFTASELITLCNAMYNEIKNEEKVGTSFYFRQLYSDMMIARDLCQYGHIDNFGLAKIIQYRNEFKGFLSKDDAKIFNNCLENDDIPTAFKNPDFVRIYERIVGDECGDNLIDLAEEDDD